LLADAREVPPGTVIECHVCVIGWYAVAPLIRVSVIVTGSLCAPAPESSKFDHSFWPVRCRDGSGTPWKYSTYV